MTKNQVPTERISNVGPDSNRVSPIYEEIGETATSFTYTTNILYGASEIPPLAKADDSSDFAISVPCQMEQSSA